MNRDGITTGPGGGSPFFIGQITSAQHTTDGALPSWTPAPAICSSYQQAETISSRADVLAAIWTTWATWATWAAPSLLD